MASHHFISYSSADGQDFALRLAADLEANSIPVWLDKYELKPGLDWDEQIVGGIQTCETLLFLMTNDSVNPLSVTKNEWTLALKYKKPVIPLLMDRAAELPFRLGSLQYINFVTDYDTATVDLLKHIRWLTLPEGQLQSMKDRLNDARRSLLRADTPEDAVRIQDHIAKLVDEIDHQQKVVDDPAGTEERLRKSIEQGLERERQPEQTDGETSRTRYINPPPVIAPKYFQDRHIESKLVGDFLKNDAQRMMTVVGRAGIGKTAMVCRLLRILQEGQLPDGLGPLTIDGIVYLSESGGYKVSVPNIHNGLRELLSEQARERVDAAFQDPMASTKDQMQALMAEFRQGRTVLLLDNIEDILDEERRIKEAALKEVLESLLDMPSHAVKVILTSSFRPQDLAQIHPGRQASLNLDEGLPSPYAENILRELDADGTLDLKSAPDELLNEARVRTRGNPRALEHLYGILAADWSTTLPDILADTINLLPERVTEVLVGEAFSRLDLMSQEVIEALAAYGRPVSASAVDFLLQPYRSGVNSTPILNKLVNMQFVRKEAMRYHLHQIDRDYALSRIPLGEEVDRADTRQPVFTRFALWNRAANYFMIARKPKQDWLTIEDLDAPLAEFELRYTGRDFDTAARVLFEIDFDYLFLWGYFSLVLELHERLQGNLTDSDLKLESLSTMGGANYSMGRYQEAIDQVDRALALARETGNRAKECTTLGNLATIHTNLGQYQQALELYEQAQTIAVEIGDRKNEGGVLGNLAKVYLDLGQTNQAVERYEQALAIAVEIGDLAKRGLWLNNLGECYANLGDTERAIQYYNQALASAQENGDRRLQATCLNGLAGSFIDRGDYDQANSVLQQAIEIADVIEALPQQSASRRLLASLLMFHGDLSAARKAAEEAGEHLDKPFYASQLALLGTIAIRQGDLSTALIGFGEALDRSGELVEDGTNSFEHLDTMGLVLCGLTLCNQGDRCAEAILAFTAARDLNRDAGIVRRLLLWFDALAIADSDGRLINVREAAAGSPNQESSLIRMQ
jgi:tetratricopeptide (TPR) repeat protein